MPNPTLIRVLEIPSSDGNFRFGGGQPQMFVEVDWFHDASEIPDFPPGEVVPTVLTEEGRSRLTEFIMEKNYFDRSKAYLVLCPLFSFTINYDGGR